jgi:hypothetical protein
MRFPNITFTLKPVYLYGLGLGVLGSMSNQQIWEAMQYAGNDFYYYGGSLKPDIVKEAASTGGIDRIYSIMRDDYSRRQILVLMLSAAVSLYDMDSYAKIKAQANTEAEQTAADEVPEPSQANKETDTDYTSEDDTDQADKPGDKKKSSGWPMWVKVAAGTGMIAGGYYVVKRMRRGY